MNKFTLPAGTTNRHQWHKPTLDAIRDLDRVSFQRRELSGVKAAKNTKALFQPCLQLLRMKQPISF